MLLFAYFRFFGVIKLSLFSRLSVFLLVFLVASSSLDSPGYLQVVCYSPGSLGIFLFSWFSRFLPAIMVRPSCFLFSWSPMLFLFSWSPEVVSYSPGPPKLSPILLVPHVVSCSPGPPCCFLFSWSPKLFPILLVPQIVSYSPGPPYCLLFSWSPMLFPVLLVPQIVSYSRGPPNCLLFS